MTSGDSPLDTDPMAKAIRDEDLVPLEPMSNEQRAQRDTSPQSAEPDLLASVKVPLIRSDGSDFVFETGSPDAVALLENELASTKLANEVLEERMAKLDQVRQEAADGEHQVDVLRAMMVNLESERDQAWEVADELRRRCAVMEERLRDRPASGEDAPEGASQEGGIPVAGEGQAPRQAGGIDPGLIERIQEVEASSRKLRSAVQRSTTQIQHYLFELESARGGIARNLEEQSKHGEAITRLHSGVATLESFVTDEDTPEVDPRVPGMIEEVRLATNQLRMLSQRSGRFGKSISAMLDRLTKVLMT